MAMTFLLKKEADKQEKKPAQVMRPFSWLYLLPTQEQKIQTL